MQNFMFFLTVHLASVLVNDQPDTQFFFRIHLFQFSTCFEHPCAHHQENRTNTTSGICQVWMELFPSKLAHQTVTYIQLYIPDILLIQLILLMMSTGVLETCRELE